MIKTKLSLASVQERDIKNMRVKLLARRIKKIYSDYANWLSKFYL